MTLRTVAIAAIITSAGIFSQASASTLYEIANDATSTGISGGSTSNSYKRIGGTQGFKAINRITNYEKGDRPCRVKVKMRHLNKYIETQDSESLKSNCTGDKITGGYGGSETYIRAVRVCTNNGSKIKGIRVWGSELDRSTGALRNVAMVEDKRPNCNQWETKRTCPAGKVVTEIKANYNGVVGSTGMYHGIELICQSIVPQ